MQENNPDNRPVANPPAGGFASPAPAQQHSPQQHSPQQHSPQLGSPQGASHQNPAYQGAAHAAGAPYQGQPAAGQPGGAAPAPVSHAPVSPAGSGYGPPGSSPVGAAAAEVPNFVPYTRFPDLEKNLEGFLKHKMPQMPETWKPYFVKAMPWLAIVGVLFTIPTLLILFSLNTLLMPFAVLDGFFSSLLRLVGTTLTLVYAVVTAISVPKLFRREGGGWAILFYGVLLGAISSVLSFSLSFLLVDALWMYCLFFIKYAYSPPARAAARA